jgi:hypothetical protein
MGETATLPLFRPTFNKSLSIESRPERLSNEAGAVILRELMERLGLMPWLTERLSDSRKQSRIKHGLAQLLRTMLLLFAQGWRDQDDADTLRQDPILKVCASSRRGLSMLAGNEGGLASQPTLSRLLATLADPGNRLVLRDALCLLAGRRLKATRNNTARLRQAIVDVDSLPIEVHGQQPGSEYNGHYHARIYHPIIATLGGHGDILDLCLREGNVHTAQGSLAFVLPLLDEVQRQVCQIPAVRVDAGFPDEDFLSALERRATPYLCRVKNNQALDKKANPYLRRPPGRPPAKPRTWFVELDHRAKTWSRSRRAVLVLIEKPGELFLHHFWLFTNWSMEQMPAQDLLALYRQRGTAEAGFGEFVNCLQPALSSAARPKSHYRGKTPRQSTACRNAFGHNEAILLLHALAYNLAHAGRRLLEKATGQGWSLKRFQERVLKVATRLLLHSKKATMVLAQANAKLWTQLWRQIQRLAPLRI